ncbi:MAG: hypothetical protein ACOY45_09460 [Pseudomonadota bacterium]
MVAPLLSKDERSRSSHQIALVLRDNLKNLAVPAGGSFKVVEMPPGPPVLATLLAEIYGSDKAVRRATAGAVERRLSRASAERPSHGSVDSLCRSRFESG